MAQVVLWNLTSRHGRKATELFKDDEEQMMAFVVEHDLGLTRAALLERQGKHREAVIQYLHEGQESEALDLALENIDDVTRDVDIFNAIIRTFYGDISHSAVACFGCRGRPESAVIPLDKIVELLKRIPDANLNDGHKKMVCGPGPSCTRETADPYEAALRF